MFCVQLAVVGGAAATGFRGEQVQVLSEPRCSPLCCRRSIWTMWRYSMGDSGNPPGMLLLTATVAAVDPVVCSYRLDQPRVGANLIRIPTSNFNLG